VKMYLLWTISDFYDGYAKDELRNLGVGARKILRRHFYHLCKHGHGTRWLFGYTAEGSHFGTQDTIFRGFPGEGGLVGWVIELSEIIKC